MKILSIIFVAAILSAPSLLATPQSHRGKRLSAKTHFKIDKEINNPNSINETDFNEIKLEKALKEDVRVEKADRADQIGREPIRKPTAKGKQRRNTHIREWP